MTNPSPYSEFTPEEERRIFYEGIRLFNEHDFFEAHETWEDIWSATTGKKSKFYQGLIQAAVTLEHMRRSNPPGVQRVWHTTQQKFANLPEIFMGVNIPKFLAGIEAVIKEVLQMPTKRGQRPHDITINWNPTDIPPLTLKYDPWETSEAQSL